MLYWCIELEVGMDGTVYLYYSCIAYNRLIFSIKVKNILGFVWKYSARTFRWEREIESTCINTIEIVVVDLNIPVIPVLSPA